MEGGKPKKLNGTANSSWTRDTKTETGSGRCGARGTGKHTIWFTH